MSRADPGIDHSLDMDLAGRVMAIEQRLKGLQGRTSALEARLSSPEGADAGGTAGTTEDFVVAMSPAAVAASRGPAIADRETPSPEPRIRGGSAITGRTRPGVDATGLIAGGILIGAGVLLFAGNFDLIKNPIVAMGCGVLLAGTALRRLVL